MNTDQARKKSTEESRDWLFVPRPNREAKLRLFCFCYAGGNATVFRPWVEQLSDSIELCAIQLPGRGARFKEPLIDNMETVLLKLEEVILPVTRLPFAFFGHSMGASIAFELSRSFQHKGHKLPECLMVSGRRAPHLPPLAGRRPLHQLPKAEFFERLGSLNGTPEELLLHEDLMNLMEPVLRNDFKLIETWSYKGGARLELPIHVFAGMDDEYLDAEAVAAWQDLSVRAGKTYYFSGDHFYLNHCKEELLGHINSLLDIT